MAGGRGERAVSPARSDRRSWRLVRADSDAVPPSARRFMARARQRRMQAALPWAVTAAVLVVAGLLGWLLFGTSVLRVREVRVVGAQTMAPAQVLQAAAVPTTMPLARVDLDEVRDRVQALAPVDRAVVSRSWPGTLRIEVVERTPTAGVPVGQQYALIDDEGVPFHTVDRLPDGLPMARLAQPGPGDVNTRAALTVLSALTAELREQLLAISVLAPAQVRLELRRERTVIWGDDTQSEAKARVATVLLAHKGATIDVSAPEVVSIR